MASVYQDKNSTQLDKRSKSGSNLAAAIGSTVGKSTADSTADGYSARLNALMWNGTLRYTPGDSVTSAQEYLDQVTANSPGSYQSKYTSQLSSLYDRIMNRGGFSYDMNADAVYEKYAQRYRQLGAANLRDAVGRAAANTGGYGNSYAQTSGQAAYQDSIESLAQMGSSLQSQALSRYNDETEQMRSQYETAAQADSADYQRYADAYSRWQNERDYAADRYDTAYSQDYGQWQNSLDTAMTLYGMEREDADSAASAARTQAMVYIKAGIMPGESLLAQTGWDAASVKALVKKYR